MENDEKHCAEHCVLVSYNENHKKMRNANCKTWYIKELHENH